MACLVALWTGCSSGETDAGDAGGTGPSCDLASAHIDIPLDHGIAFDDAGDPESFVVATSGGPIRVLFTPWGTHTEPHTGSPGLEAKTNWQGFLVRRDERSELAGDGDGVCEVSEVCGVDEETVRARRPFYVAPDDGFEVEEVMLEAVSEPGHYWGTRNQWRIEADLCGYHYTFGHVGWIVEDLREAMIAAGAPDPDTYDGPLRANLLSEPVPLAAAARFAIPQIVGTADPAHPGFVVGDPWAQMEVPTYDHRIVEPIYRRLPAETQDALRQILWREMADPESRMYSGWESFAWLWKAEADLWLFEGADVEDYGSLLSHLGAWFENRPAGEPCVGVDPLCDQSLSIWPILEAGPIYDPTLYDSPDVSFLILKSQRGGSWFRGEVLSPTTTLGMEGTLFVKWRLETYITEIERYQKISFVLDPEARLLKLHFGAEDESRTVVESMADPAIPTSMPCDGVTVACMTHDWAGSEVRLPGY